MIDPDTLADKFADELRRALSPEQWQEMRRRNATPAYQAACASHDFTDANDVMESAFGAGLWAADGESMDESALAIWNQAWGIAKRKHLTA